MSGFLPISGVFDWFYGRTPLKTFRRHRTTKLCHIKIMKAILLSQSMNKIFIRLGYVSRKYHRLDNIQIGNLRSSFLQCSDIGTLPNYNTGYLCSNEHHSHWQLAQLIKIAPQIIIYECSYTPRFMQHYTILSFKHEEQQKLLRCLPHKKHLYKRCKYANNQW